jgi:hypothetical protein
MVADYKLPNKRSSYNGLSRQLVKARELGDVDDTRIEDRSRSVLGGDSGFSSPGQYLQAKIQAFSGNYYTRRMWADQPNYVEVWVEKDALSRVVSGACEGFRVVVAPSRGYSSYTYLKREAVDTRFYEYADRPIIILDFRDHDPSGIQMTQDLQTRLSKYASESDIIVKRIALTWDQVQRYHLDPNPVKNADTRSAAYVEKYGSSCWELDALPPEVLSEMVRKAVSQEIDEDIWHETFDRSKKEKEELQPKIDALAKLLKDAVNKP